jgi:alginate O-acetyltransferase complex protein AlgI
MVFSSLPFLFCFFPIAFTLYLLVPARGRNLYLLLVSTIFYAAGEGWYTLLLIGTVCVNWALGRAIERASDNRAAHLLLAAGIGANLLLLAIFKYAAFLAEAVNGSVGSAVLAPPQVHLPIGISFFTFQAISYLIDVARRDVPAERALISYGTYKTFFPQLIAGPIVRYRDVRDEVHHRAQHIDDVVAGIHRFVIGLGKKVLIADTLAKPTELAMALPPDELTFAAAWFGVACFALQIYFDFSGYSDMAIGMGRMFGFHFRENFDYPYTAASIREFWRRWHISLSSWFRDYLYVPLGGSRCGPARTIGNLLLVFALCGLWHGASWTFVAWGVFHGALVALEFLGLGRMLDALPRLAGRLYTLVALGFGWALFRADSLTKATSLWAAMVGNGDAAFAPPWHQMCPNDVVCAFVVAAVGALGAAAGLTRMIDRVAAQATAAALVCAALRVAALGVVLYASALVIAATTFNSFIYFRF